jgi:hypothetical protein
MKSYNFIIIIIFIVGLVITVRELTLRTMQCKPQKTEYKWIPRTMDMNLDDSKNVTKIFSDIFQRAEPWTGMVQTEYIEKKELEK